MGDDGGCAPVHRGLSPVQLLRFGSHLSLRHSCHPLKLLLPIQHLAFIASLDKGGLPDVEIEHGSFALLLIDVILEPLLQLIILLVNFVHVAIDHALAVHGGLVPIIELKVLFVQRIFDFEMLPRKFGEEVDHERPLGLVLLQHTKDEVLQILRVLALKNRRLLVQYLVHQAIDAFVVEW